MIEGRGRLTPGCGSKECDQADKVIENLGAGSLHIQVHETAERSTEYQGGVRNTHAIDPPENGWCFAFSCKGVQRPATDVQIGVCSTENED